MTASTEVERILEAIAAQEALRGTVPDEVIDTTLVALRARIVALEGGAGTRLRRQVTVLFADVSGFTAMGESMDPEELGEVLDGLWARIDAAIGSWGGRIDKHIGDAVMATWGMTEAREDDPERAVRAALAMQETLATLPLAHGVPLALRIGINTGNVIAGPVGSAGEVTVLGDAVNVAARLQQAAPVGGVLIGQETSHHVRGIFDLERRDPLAVKGRVQPVQTHLVLGVRPRAFRPRSRGIEGVDTPMIGRARELEQLEEALRAAIADRHVHVVTVLGEAGLSKSRLLAEFEHRIRCWPEPLSVFRARADQLHQGIPNALIRDLFLFRFDIAEDDPPEVASSRLREGLATIAGADAGDDAAFVAHLIGVDVSGDAAISGLVDDAEYLRERGVVAIARLLAAASATPLVLLLEDVHWADRASMEVLDRIVSACTDHPVLVVVLARPSLLERFPAWGRGAPWCHRIDLRPLTGPETGELADALLRSLGTVPAEIRARATEGADGNPYYVEEAVRMLIDDGVIVVGPDRWTLAPQRLAEPRVPLTLTGILQARLDRLAPVEREVLRRAAVVGPVFWDAAIPPAGLTEAERLAALRTLEARDLIVCQAEPGFVGCREYRFAHSILHRATYDSVLRPDRRRHHAWVAAWLEARGDGDAQAVLIAHHLEAAGLPQRAAPWYAAAARRAMDRYALDEAVGHLRAALRPGLLPPEVALPLFAELNDVLTVRARYDEALEVAQVMVGVADGAALGEHQVLARVVTAMALSRLGRVREALHRVGEAEHLLVSRPVGQVARGSFLVELGWLRLRLGQAEDAVRCGEGAIALLGPSGARREAMNARSLTGCAYSALGRYETAATHLAEALVLARDRDDRRNEAASLLNLAELARLSGDGPRAVELIGEVLVVLREIGDRDQEALALSNLGGALVGCGRFAEAVTALTDALAALERSGAAEHTSETHRFLAEAHLGLGQPERALPEAHAAMRAAREGENPDQLGHAWRVLGLVAHARRAPVSDGSEAAVHDALACLAASEAVFAEAGMACDRARALVDHATVLDELGDTDGADRLRAEARAVFAGLGLSRLVAAVDR